MNVFDGRPEKYSPSVESAISRAMETTRAWRAGQMGEDALKEIEQDARAAMRLAFDLPPQSRIIFTSGVEEARNTAIKGLAWGADAGRNEIVTVAGDPAGFEESALWCGRFGFKSLQLIPGKVGEIAFPLLDRLISAKTAVVALLSATPEIYRWRIPEIRKLSVSCEARGAELALDLSLEVLAKKALYDGSKITLMCDGAALSGPVGAAFVALRPGARFGPLVSGGADQDGLRGGRLNPSLVAGLGAAATEYAERAPDYFAHLTTLRETALEELHKQIPSARLAHGEAPLPVGITFIVPGVEGEAVVMMAEREGINVDSGSECLRRTGKVSPVLTAAGFTAEDAAGSVQMFFRAGQTIGDVKRAIETIGKSVGKLKGMG